MAQFCVLFSALPFIFFHGNAQSPSEQSPTGSFRPSLSLVIAIVSIMFALTFVLMIYAKCCHAGADPSDNNALRRQIPSSPGVDKLIIESLPFFTFSSLKGTKKGLECAVCLSRFEDVDVLRLIPRCNHAFHIACVDRWLEGHSTCPLCRHRVTAEEAKLVGHSNSFRYLRDLSDSKDESNLEIFVEREEAKSRQNSWHGMGGSFRRYEKGESVKMKQQFPSAFHKLNHKIVLTGTACQSRWSNLSSSDLMLLNSGEKRSMSEIAGYSRFREEDKFEESNLRLPIAKKSADLFATREAASQGTSYNTRHNLDV